MALESFNNTATGETDAYITFVTTRDTNHAHGWNSFGFGDSMDGALMFVMYGDPADKSATGPTVSVRTATEHNRPTIVESHPEAGQFPDVRVINTEFITQRSSSAVTLSAQIICYSCDKWTGRPVSQPFQSFIWAVNIDQDFESDFTATADLDHHTFNSGRGVFFANIDRSFVSFEANTAQTSNANETNIFLHPEIDVTTITTHLKPSTNIGTQENLPPGLSSQSSSSGMASPGEKSIKSQLFLIHGILLSVSFLLLLPLGAMAMRVPARLLPYPPFKIHLTLQLLGTVSALVSMTLALILSRHWLRWHQSLGILVYILLLVQAYLGHTHHQNYLRTKSSTPFITPSHVILGRLLLLLGWTQIVLGLFWASWPSLFLLAVLGIITIEAGAVFFAHPFLLFIHRYILFSDSENSSTTSGWNRDKYNIPASRRRRQRELAAQHQAQLARSARDYELDSFTDPDDPETQHLARALDHHSDDDSSQEDDNGEPVVYSKESFGGMPSTGLMAGIPAKGLEDAEEDDRERGRWAPGASGSGS